MSDKIKLNKIKLSCKIDESPDLSYYGEWTDTWSAGCVDRQKTGMWKRGECRYFKPANCDGWEDVTDEDVDTAFDKMPLPWRKHIEQEGETKRSVLEEYQAYQNCRRMEAYGSGGADDWSCIGIIAKAEIVVNSTIQWIQSGGVWGIESDSPPQDFSEVMNDQVLELIDILTKLGIGDRAIEHAVDKMDMTEPGVYLDISDLKVDASQRPKRKRTDFAKVVWRPQDVIDHAEVLQMTMTKQDAEKWLHEHENDLRDILITRGNEEIANILAGSVGFRSKT
jgi:hypothetical protein